MYSFLRVSSCLNCIWAHGALVNFSFDKFERTKKEVVGGMDVVTNNPWDSSENNLHSL